MLTHGNEANRPCDISYSLSREKNHHCFFFSLSHTQPYIPTYQHIYTHTDTVSVVQMRKSARCKKWENWLYT